MKNIVTHAELMQALDILGFPNGDVFKLEIRPREPADITIGAGKDPEWVLVATMPGLETEAGGRVIPPYAVRVVTIPVLMPRDENKILQDRYPVLGEEEISYMDSQERAGMVTAALDTGGKP